MLFEYRTHRTVGLTSGAAVLGLSAVATFAATHPAAAQAALTSMAGSVTCATSTAGTSHNAAGVYGKSTSGPCGVYGTAYEAGVGR